MNEDRTTKKVFNAQPIGPRRKGRPNFRWIDGLDKDLLVLRTRLNENFQMAREKSNNAITSLSGGSPIPPPVPKERYMAGNQARRLRTVREDTGAPSEGATCAWIAADEAVGCTRAFLMMWWSSRRLVCRGRPEPGLRVNQ
ncbi:uncharacterized protein TNCV_3594571 [Trichonephila clavipes]|nr:uncharacterized protein TNCV_3594571 [Trichonephila clavipes]